MKQVEKQGETFEKDAGESQQCTNAANSGVV